MVNSATPFPRISRDPGVMGGRPGIRGLRVTVGTILGNLGDGVTVDELLLAYPYLVHADILDAIRYAAWLAEEREIVLAPAA